MGSGAFNLVWTTTLSSHAIRLYSVPPPFFVIFHFFFNLSILSFPSRDYEILLIIVFINEKRKTLNVVNFVSEEI